MYANFTYTNLIAAVSFIYAIGISLTIKWQLQYHLFQVFVIVFTDRQLKEQSWSFSVFKLQANYGESLLFPWFQIQSKYGYFVKNK